MGFDTDRFEDCEISEELICSICTGVLEDPLTTHCDHLFCNDCINDWLRDHHTCPIDRCPLRSCMLKRAPRAIRNLINRLKIYCPYRMDGCKQTFCLEQFEQHRLQCSYNPDSMVQCKLYCQRLIKRRDINQHDCIKELANMIKLQRKQLNDRDKQIQILYLILTILIMIFLLIYLFLPLPLLLNQFARLTSIFCSIMFDWSNYL
ncbi:E3 ubiquitin-protein ligase NRDP1-like [Dermatophagoides pteronyssinus]|uniref:E3 ubiquitin-protein ligase NRDP1-like n=2 Tax=Dermatophagoides pteronyssinus TaxID=6956 RepID=A0A6P6Y331_DERPT|nr:E3 ubiquitin-protein ligase NRDP1-like [Dermatophagoides pteronyssinus]KAH9413319.1 E3 ubiquitin-protein ligase NRDP1 [Dermatophagoides pteronyssinus]